MLLSFLISFLISLLYVLYFRKFVQSFIDFPKPLVAAVNGPAIGIACTTLGLFDTVYASDAVSYLFCMIP